MKDKIKKFKCDNDCCYFIDRQKEFGLSVCIWPDFSKTILKKDMFGGFIPQENCAELKPKCVYCGKTK